jgi:hypothetical protein
MGGSFDRCRAGAPIECVFAADMVHVLRWQLDLNWLLRAGQDPYRWLEFGRGRISSFHAAPIGRC